MEAILNLILDVLPFVANAGLAIIWSGDVVIEDFLNRAHARGNINFGDRREDAVDIANFANEYRSVRYSCYSSFLLLFILYQNSILELLLMVMNGQKITELEVTAGALVLGSVFLLSIAAEIYILHSASKKLKPRSPKEYWENENGLRLGQEYMIKANAAPAVAVLASNLILAVILN